MPMSAREQSARDAAVRRWAESLRRQGYDVVAGVKGFTQPGPFYGLIPDIVAMKGKRRIIGVVETPGSVGDTRAEARRLTFKRMENMSCNTSFLRRITRT